MKRFNRLEVEIMGMTPTCLGFERLVLSGFDDRDYESSYFR